MRNLLLIYTILFSFSCLTQIPDGKWYGAIKAMGTEMPIGVSIETVEGEQKAFLINPDNEKLKYKFDSVSISQKSFYFKQSQLKAVFSGNFSNNNLNGVFQQNGMEFDLLLTPNPYKKKKIIRPQTPTPPFDYYTEQIEAYNILDSVTLSGTLTLPSNDGKKYPVVVLVSGSGPQNRDSEILKHKSFAVIADHLAKQGIGSFRYDERGVGQSTGKYSGSDLGDFYRDLDAVIKKISMRKDVSKLGILGHSEGGILAPKYASEHKKKIDFVIMMGAPGIPISEMMHLQRNMIFKGQGMSAEEIEKQKKLFVEVDKIVTENSEVEKTKKLKSLFTDYAHENEYSEIETKQYVDVQMATMNGDWYKSFVSITPDDYLKKVRCSVLVLAGGKDVQVPMNENVDGIAKSLEKSKPRFLRKRILVYNKYSNLNHLMQPAESGMPEEYGKIETTIDRGVLFAISDFISQLR